MGVKAITSEFGGDKYHPQKGINLFQKYKAKKEVCISESKRFKRMLYA